MMMYIISIKSQTWWVCINLKMQFQKAASDVHTNNNLTFLQHGHLSTYS